MAWKEKDLEVMYKNKIASGTGTKEMEIETQWCHQQTSREVFTEHNEQFSE